MQHGRSSWPLGHARVVTACPTEQHMTQIVVQPLHASVDLPLWFDKYIKPMWLVHEQDCCKQQAAYRNLIVRNADAPRLPASTASDTSDQPTPMHIPFLLFQARVACPLTWSDVHCLLISSLTLFRSIPWQNACVLIRQSVQV